MISWCTHTQEICRSWIVSSVQKLANWVPCFRHLGQQSDTCAFHCQVWSTGKVICECRVTLWCFWLGQRYYVAGAAYALHILVWSSRMFKICSWEARPLPPAQNELFTLKHRRRQTMKRNKPTNTMQHACKQLFLTLILQTSHYHYISLFCQFYT